MSSRSILGAGHWVYEACWTGRCCPGLFWGHSRVLSCRQDVLCASQEQPQLRMGGYWGAGGPSFLDFGWEHSEAFCVLLQKSAAGVSPSCPWWKPAVREP